MSDFSISSEQRQKLLEGVYRPLMFDVKPAGCEPGSRYVLVWSRPSVVVVGEGTDVEVVRTPRAPAWFLTVKSTNRVRKGDRLVWLVRFDVTDLRDRDVFLKPGGGELQGRDPLGGGRKPDAALRSGASLSTGTSGEGGLSLLTIRGWNQDGQKARYERLIGCCVAGAARVVEEEPPGPTREQSSGVPPAGAKGDAM